MKIKRLLGASLAGLVMIPFAPGIAAATDTPQWRLCRDVANRWPAADERAECAMVTVPVDYAVPRGRTVDIAISRVKAAGRRDGVVLLNPGGPGGSGMELPNSILNSRAAGIGVHHDLIGFTPAL